MKLPLNTKTLRIIPEYKDCFSYEKIISEVKPNDIIEVGIDENKNRLSNNIESVVSIRINSKEYINRNCVNKSIQKQKVQLPILILVLAIFIATIIFIQKSRGRD